jgi:hypothetical protein
LSRKWSSVQDLEHFLQVFVGIGVLGMFLSLALGLKPAMVKAMKDWSTEFGSGYWWLN